MSVAWSDRSYPNRGLHGRVVHEIGLRIVSGRLEPGSALPTETELGSELAVSRSVLRESIKVLAGKGLVEVRTKTGTRVRPRRFWHLLDPDVLSWRFEEAVTQKDLVDLVEFRAIVEPPTARLAAQRRTAEGLETIGRCLAGMASAVARPAAFIAADLRFHTAIFEASGNELLEHMPAAIGVALRAGRRFRTREPERYEMSLGHHESVRDAIDRGDGDAAERAMRGLVMGARADLEHYLGS
jgi:DNA-binding FadR family transcriptional regulator